MESIYCLARLLLKEKRNCEAEELLFHAVAVYPAVVEYHTLLRAGNGRPAGFTSACRHSRQCPCAGGRNLKNSLFFPLPG
jgi:hypothetical protein